MSVNGIDVSKFQGTVDWSQVASAGIAFSYIRASDGTNPANEPNFVTNWTGATAAGLIVGAYHMLRPNTDPSNVQAQAQLFLTQITNALPSPQIQYLPAALDVEIAVAGVGNDDYATAIRTWLQVVEADGRFAGRTSVIYTRASFWAQIGNPSEFTSRPLWVADYSQDPPRLPVGWTSYTFFQNSETGAVTGINGNVDTDSFNGTTDQLAALASPSAT